MVVSILESLLMFHYFIRFIDKRAKSYHYFLFAAIYNAMIYLLPMTSFFELAFYMILLLAYGMLISRANIKIVLLYAVVTVEIMLLCFGISKSFTGILSPLLFPLNPGLMSLFFMAAGTSLALFSSFLCYEIVRRYFSCSEIEPNQYVIMILVPLFMIFMLSEYVNNTVYSNTIILNSIGEMLNANHIQMFAIQVFGIFSLFCIVYAYKQLVTSFMLEQATHFQNQYVAEARSRYEKTRAFRHDVKNHLSVIHGLLEKENIDEARKYLLGIEALTNGLSFPCHTNNPVLDILIANKLGLAQSKGILASCSLVVPSPCAILDIDLCIVLSNALDNAIHACEKMNGNPEKQIQLSGCRQGDFLLLEVTNTYLEKQTYKKGIGLSNIRAIAEKYHGAMSAGYQDGFFCLSVLLIIPQHSNGISQHAY